MSYLYSLNENIDYQSDDDSIGTLINSPTNSSVSSSNSWAEDNITDNRNEWNKIERIFYGEEELPSEPNTRNEFLEWMELFPHLRIIGSKVPIYYDPNAKEENVVNEILAIDPPIERYNSRCKSSSRKPNTDEIFFTRKSSKSKDNLSSDLNKFLKISRSPVMTRRQHLNNSQKSQTNETKVPYFVVPSSTSSGKTTLLNRRKFITSISSNAILPSEKDTRFSLNTSLSASVIRMPPLLNFKILNRVPQMCIKSAVYGSRNRNRTILPSIELQKTNIPSASTSSKQHQRSAGILKN